MPRKNPHARKIAVRRRLRTAVKNGSVARQPCESWAPWLRLTIATTQSRLVCDGCVLGTTWPFTLPRYRGREE